MKWSVEILNEAVLAELEALPSELRARLTRIVELIEDFGLEQLREPYVKHLQGKLWEIRVKGRDGIARAIYVTAHQRRVVIVLVFQKKTRKTPRSVLKLAQRRAREVT